MRLMSNDIQTGLDIEIDLPEVETEVSPAARLEQKLRQKYQAPEWAFLTQVKDHVSPTRYADGIAIQNYRSRGNSILGFEIKVARSDWLSELRNPDKSDYFVTRTDKWYLATTQGVAKAEEIPEAWGWIELRGSRLVTAKEAPKREAFMDKQFAIALLQRLRPSVETEVEARYERERERLRKMTENRVQCDHKFQLHRLEELEEEMGKIRKATGIGSWDIRKLSESQMAHLFELYDKESDTLRDITRQAAYWTKLMAQISESANKRLAELKGGVDNG